MKARSTAAGSPVHSTTRAAFPKPHALSSLAGFIVRHTRSRCVDPFSDSLTSAIGSTQKRAFFLLIPSLVRWHQASSRTCASSRASWSHSLPVLAFHCWLPPHPREKNRPRLLESKSSGQSTLLPRPRDTPTLLPFRGQSCQTCALLSNPDTRRSGGAPVASRAATRLKLDAEVPAIAAQDDVDACPHDAANRSGPHHQRSGGCCSFRFAASPVSPRRRGAFVRCVGRELAESPRQCTSRQRPCDWKRTA